MFRHFPAMIWISLSTVCNAICNTSYNYVSQNWVSVYFFYIFYSFILKFGKCQDTFKGYGQVGALGPPGVEGPGSKGPSPWNVGWDI